MNPKYQICIYRLIHFCLCNSNILLKKNISFLLMWVNINPTIRLNFSFYLSIYLSIYPSIHLFINAYISIFMFIYLSCYLCLSLSIQIFVVFHSFSLYFSSLYICTYVYIPQFPKSPWDSEKGGETWWKKNFYVICLMQPDVDGAHMFCFIKIVVFIGGKIKSIFLLLFFLEAEYLSNPLVSNTRKFLFFHVWCCFCDTRMCARLGTHVVP